MDNTNSFQAGWNLAEPMLFDIANRLRQARDYLLMGSLERYYWNMETIVRMLYGFLTQAERERCLESELVIQKYLPVLPNKKNELSMLLKKYDGLVMDLLHHHKFLVPPKADKTRLIG